MNEPVGLLPQVERSVQQIHAENPQGLLLAHRFLVQQTDVDQEVGRRLPRRVLEANAHPAVTILWPRITPRCHRVGKGKEVAVGPFDRVQALHDQIELVIQHRLQTLATDVSFGRPVQGVAHRHVIGRDGLGHRAGGPAHAKEPARHLLTRADLGKRAVPSGIEIDPQRLLVRTARFFPMRFHETRSVAGPINDGPAPPATPE